MGIEAVLTEANVARRSLYEHFGGKDGLIEAVLARAAEQDLAWYEAALASSTDPHERLLGVFDHLHELVSDPQFRGCRYFATDLALADPDHPAHATADTFRARLRSLLLRELHAMRHPRPEEAADRLHLLIEGTLVMGATQVARRPALAARELAAAVLG